MDPGQVFTAPCRGMPRNYFGLLGGGWVETRLTSLVGKGLGELLELQLLKDLFWEAKGALRIRQAGEGPIGCPCIQSLSRKKAREIH